MEDSNFIVLLVSIVALIPLLLLTFEIFIYGMYYIVYQLKKFTGLSE